LSCNRASWRIIRPAYALLSVVFCHNAIEGTPYRVLPYHTDGQPSRLTCGPASGYCTNV
jgi:hypothetical protein